MFTDIWTFDVERGTLTRLSFGNDGDFNDLPIWTSDGRRVVYSGSAEGKRGLSVAPADASAKPTLLLASESAVVPRTTTPDGKMLIYSETGPDKRRRFMVMPVSVDGKPGPTGSRNCAGAHRRGNDSRAQDSYLR